MKTLFTIILGATIMASVLSSANCEEPIPPVLKGGFPSFETPLPASADAWERQNPRCAKTLATCSAICRRQVRRKSLSNRKKSATATRANTSPSTTAWVTRSMDTC